MVRFFGLYCCVVAATLMVGVHLQSLYYRCLPIQQESVVTKKDPSEFEIYAVFSEVYGDAIGRLTEGSCSQQEAEAVAKASATAKAVAQAVVKAFKLEFVKMTRCVEDDAKVASAYATAQICANAHIGAIAEVLTPSYFPLSFVFVEVQSVADSFEPIFVEIFSEATVIGSRDVGLDVVFDSDKQDAVVTAIAQAFAKAVATYTIPEGKSYCPL